MLFGTGSLMIVQAAAGTVAVPASVSCTVRHARPMGGRREGFPPRQADGDWPATRMCLGTVLDMLSRCTIHSGEPGHPARADSWRGAPARLAWRTAGGHMAATLARHRGRGRRGGWRQRATAGWTSAVVHIRERHDLLSLWLIWLSASTSSGLVGLAVVWGVSSWSLARYLERSRDPGGSPGWGRPRPQRSTRQRTACRDRPGRHHRRGRRRHACGGDRRGLPGIAGCRSRSVADRRRQRRVVAAAAPGGVFGPTRRPRWRQLRTIGQRTPGADRPLPAVRGRSVTCWSTICKNASPPSTTRAWIRWPTSSANFWADLGAPSPRYRQPEPAPRGRDRVEAAAAHQDHGPPRRATRCLSLRGSPTEHTLLAVRALYLDLARWAVEDPARWAPWAAPCPVSKADVNSRKEERQRKSRMDARTRERLPVLPVLVAPPPGTRRTASTLHAARHAEPGSCSALPATPRPDRRPQAAAC